MRSLPTWLFWALLSAAFAALTAVFGKVGVTGVNPDYATLIRTIVILVFIAGLVMATGAAQPFSAITPKSYLFLTLSGLATGASWLCYYRALQLGPASKVAPVDKLSVIFVAIFAFIFLGERLSASNWLGVVLIVAGVILASIKG